MLVTILGRRYVFSRERLSRGVYGTCDAPNATGKAIRISSRLDGLLELDTIIHECRHAENWDMYDEKYVGRVSADLALILWRLGYRKEKA
jgi:hypothetical protein